MSGIILALDFGGTKLSAALFEGQSSRKGRQEEQAFFSSLRPSRPLREPLYTLLDLRRVITLPDADAAHELAAMLALARELLAGRKPSAVGVSFGGPVAFAAGLVRRSDHVPGWDSFPLRERLAAEFGCPVAVDNDANVAALGEHHFGAGRGFDDLLYVTVSTGVGGGWILGGRAWRGAAGMAGEIGHIVVDPNGPPCLCGKRGCVERLASGPYMAADYVARVAYPRGEEPAAESASSDADGLGRSASEDAHSADPHSADPRSADPRSADPRSADPRSADPRSALKPGPWNLAPASISGRDVAERAAAGDEAARAILLRGAWALGVGIGNAANLLNPQRFVLGGGVTKAGEAWWAEVRRAAAATAVAGVTFDIVPAALGDDAPLWGALALAEKESTDFTD